MPPEPAPVAFANTRSSSGRDRIATLTQWRAWVDAWPGLRSAGRRVDANGLIALRGARDDVQALLRGERAASARIADLAAALSRHEVRWRAGRPVLSVPNDGDPAAVIAHHLARATLDLLLTGPPLGVCEGEDCRKVFVATRPDRRWCASKACGNRARVRAHRERRD